MVGDAQAAPWSKTGGLGDVCGSLPQALAARGHRVMVVIPLYEEYEGVDPTGVCKVNWVYVSKYFGFCLYGSTCHSYLDHTLISHETGNLRHIW